MDLADAKRLLTESEQVLTDNALAEFANFETPYGGLAVYVSARLRRTCRKQKVWKSNAMLTAVKNSAYGFNSDAPRSRGGADGIFLIDRGHRPENSTMRKIFQHFLDKPDALVGTISELCNVQASDLLPVRVVSHHMRLLGVMVRGTELTRLVLVDCDREKS